MAEVGLFFGAGAMSSFRRASLAATTAECPFVQSPRIRRHRVKGGQEFLPHGVEFCAFATVNAGGHGEVIN